MMKWKKGCVLVATVLVLVIMAYMMPVNAWFDDGGDGGGGIVAGNLDMEILVGETSMTDSTLLFPDDVFSRIVPYVPIYQSFTIHNAGSLAMAVQLLLQFDEGATSREGEIYYGFMLGDPVNDLETYQTLLGTLKPLDKEGFSVGAMAPEGEDQVVTLVLEWRPTETHLSVTQLTQETEHLPLVNNFCIFAEASQTQIDNDTFE